jgi:hypothetical protein
VLGVKTARGASAICSESAKMCDEFGSGATPGTCWSARFADVRVVAGTHGAATEGLHLGVWCFRLEGRDPELWAELGPGMGRLTEGGCPRFLRPAELVVEPEERTPGDGQGMGRAVDVALWEAGVPAEVEVGERE